MATYVSKLWADRQSTYPNRRTLSWIDPDTQQEKTLTVTVTREEGTVTVEGDPFAALVMNGLEERISNAFATCDSILVSTNSPTAADGKNNDMFVKYSTSGGSTTITNLYIKISNAWVEVSTGGGGGSSTLSGLTDVNLSSPTDGQALVYDATSSKWVNGAGGGGSSASGVYIGTCSTAGDQSAKQVTVSSDQNFVLEKGTTINVKFANNNSATNVTISVNNGTAYPIWYNTSVYTAGTTGVTGQANKNILYVFDGSYWVWQSYGSYVAYSNMTEAESEAGTGTSGRTIQPTILKHAIDYHAPSAVRTELTQAEYDQLTDEEKNNGTMYFITDADTVVPKGIYIGTCDTAAGTAAKAITVSSDQNFVLEKGVTIAIKFANSNTASNATFSVNSGTAYPVYYNTSTYTLSNNNVLGVANRYSFYVFDGSCWVWSGMSYFYSYSNMTQAEAETATVATGRLMPPTVLKQAIQYHAIPQVDASERIVGKLGNDTLYEKVFTFAYSDMQGGSQDATRVTGVFVLESGVNYKYIMISDAQMINTNPADGKNIWSMPLPIASASGVYARVQIQKDYHNTPPAYNGLPFIYFDATYNASMIYNDGNSEMIWVFTLRYTKIS